MRIVVKIGGSIIDQDLSNLASDLKRIHEQGHQVVVVHGGAKIVTSLSERLGKQPEFVESPDGMRSRYTDKETIDIFIMAVAGHANKALVAQFLKQGIPAIGTSGFDANILQASRKTKLKIRKENKILLIDGGYTGKLEAANVGPLEQLLTAGYVPVVATLASSQQNEPLNIDGDEAARFLAQALKSDRFVILTDVPGVLDEKGQLIPRITQSELDSEISRVTAGMKRKLHTIHDALASGAKVVTVASGLRESPLSKAIAGEDCTVIE